MNSKKTENTNVNKTENTKTNKTMTIIGVILCVILIPILAVNITLIIKSQTNKDEVPKIGGYCPLIVLTGSMEPEISDGDLIIVKQIDGKDVQVKDVIAFFDPESTSALAAMIQPVATTALSRIVAPIPIRQLSSIIAPCIVAL